jgi:hypothetical protein
VRILGYVDEIARGVSISKAAERAELLCISALVRNSAFRRVFAQRLAPVRTTAAAV